VPVTAEDRRIYRFGRFRLDTGQKVLESEGTIVPLHPKAVDTLTALVENAGQIVGKDTLLRIVWPDTFVLESSLTKNISLLRKVLDSGADESVIQTVSRRGYRFVAPVQSEVTETAAAVSEPAAAVSRLKYWHIAAVLVLLIVAAFLYGRGRNASLPETLSEADREYLIGRHMWNKMERAEMQKALQRFQKACELDPGSALAFAGVADTYVMMSTLGVGMPADNLARARDAATRAIRLDPTLSLPHVSLAYVRIMADFDPAGAERDYRRALSLDSNSTPARYGYACLLSHMGRLPEARAMILRAREIDPVSPLIGVAAARIEYYDHRYQQAIALLKDVLDREPAFSQAHYYIAMSLAYLGRVEEARTHLHRARLSESLVETEAAWLHTLAGDRATARALLRQRRSLVESGRAKATVMLLPAIDAGDRDTALRALEEMARTREIELLQLKVNPRFDPLRAEPRFAAVVQRVWADEPVSRSRLRD
jgi:DNA-binding winged helix-turn-helix (wHTH) protein/Tfp pilus assembly protein PilF